MARDRKRAKQRRDRGAAVARRARREAGAGVEAATNGAATNGSAAEDENGAEGTLARARGALDRSDLPGALEHAGAEADEFDAALVRGAGGTPAGEVDQAELEAESEDALQEPAQGGAGGGRVGSAVVAGGEAARPSGAPLRAGNRVIGFARASWAELQRVQWPDRRQVTQATAVVLGFVVVAGLYLGAADTVAKEIVEFIL